MDFSLEKIIQYKTSRQVEGEKSKNKKVLHLLKLLHTQREENNFGWWVSVM